MSKIKSFFLLYLYIYSISFIYAFFVAYELGDGDIFLFIEVGLRGDISFFVRTIVWAIIPSFAITSFVILLSPYSFVFELIFYIYTMLLSGFIISQAVLFQSQLDVASIYIILYSGVGEMQAFIETFASFKLLLILSITCIIPLCLWKIARKNRCLWTLKEKGSLIVLSLCFLLIPMYHDGLLRMVPSLGFNISSIDKNIRRLFYIEFPTYIPEALLLASFETSIPTDTHALFDGTQNIILIILESSNRNQFSLYGYPRETTPKLEELDLIVYEDVLSPSPVTSKSIPHMLTFSNLQSSERITTIYDLFNSAGFTTYYFDGYGDDVNPNDVIHLVGGQADNTFRREVYDSELFDAALAVIKNDPVKKKLIIIQTGAAHFPYKQRYPTTMEEFSGTPPELYPGADLTRRNEYDTAILYLDTLIASFLADIGGEENTAVVITADHGQEIGNYSTTYGHSNYTKFLSGHEVPFLLYVSEDYKTTLEALVFDTTRPYQTDNLIHSIIDLAHIQSQFFKPEYSIFNKAYQEPTQLIQDKNYIEFKEEEEKRREIMEQE